MAKAKAATALETAQKSAQEALASIRHTQGSPVDEDEAGARSALGVAIDVLQNELNAQARRAGDKHTAETSEG